MTVSAVWNIADIFNGLMAFPNLIALFALSGIVGKETREYFKKKPSVKINHIYLSKNSLSNERLFFDYGNKLYVTSIKEFQKIGKFIFIKSTNLSYHKKFKSGKFVLFLIDIWTLRSETENLLIANKIIN